jgi:hypothetical protein
VPKVEKVISLNLPGPQGPVQACSGKSLPFGLLSETEKKWNSLRRFGCKNLCVLKNHIWRLDLLLAARQRNKRPSGQCNSSELSKIKLKVEMSTIYIFLLTILRHVRKVPLALSCLSVWNNSVLTGRIFMTFYIWVVFRKSVEKNIKFCWNLTRITGTLHEYVSTFVVTSGWIVRRIRKCFRHSCRENQNRYFMFCKFLQKKRTVYETRWRNMVEPERLPAIWRMRVVYRISNARTQIQ